MSRRRTDPRVLEVLAAFDRQRDSASRDGSMVCGFMCCVVDTGPDRFTIPGGWTDAEVRAVLLAFLVNAPDADLADMVENARKEQIFIVEHEAEMERQGAAEHAAGRVN